MPFSDEKLHVSDADGAFSKDIAKELTKMVTGSPRQARRVRSWVMKLEAMKISGNALEGLLRLASIYLSTAMGQWIFTVLLIFWLHNRGFLSDVTADELFTILTAVDVIRAIGSSNILSQTEALAGLFTGGGGSTGAAGAAVSGAEAMA